MRVEYIQEKAEHIFQGLWEDLRGSSVENKTIGKQRKVKRLYSHFNSPPNFEL